MYRIGSTTLPNAVYKEAADIFKSSQMHMYHLPGPQSGLTLTCTQREYETPRIDVTLSRTAVLLVQFYILVSFCQGQL